MTTGQYIAIQRKKKNLSQRKLAQLAGLSNTTVSRLELDETIPDTDTLIKLANILEVSYEDLIQFTKLTILNNVRELYSSIGERIRELRKEKNLTQEELGKYLAVGKSTISQYETNTNFPDLSMIHKIADLFNVSVDYLLGRSDFKNINSDFMGKDIREWVENPDNYDFLEFIYQASKKGVPKEILKKAHITVTF